MAVITTLPVPDCLNLVQHLQPRCLEDSFLTQQTRKKGTAKAQSLPTLRQCSDYQASSFSWHKRSPSKDDSSELSSQVPRLQGDFQPADKVCSSPGEKREESRPGGSPNYLGNNEHSGKALYFLSCSFIVFSFHSFSFIFFHFLSFSIIVYHFLSFSFIFFHFLSFFLCWVLKMPQFRHDFF